MLWGLAAQAAMGALTSLGCSRLSVCQVEYPGANPPTPTRGIESLLLDYASVRMLVIHGMGPQSPGYSRDLLEGLGPLLGVTATDNIVTWEICNDASAFCYGQLTRTRFRTGPDPQRALWVYELLWSPTTAPLKAEHLGDDQLPARRLQRLRLDRELKDVLVDQRLSDPVLYVGDYREAILYPVDRALRQVAEDGDDPTVFVTYSLGSRILFDAVSRLLDPAFEGASAAQKAAVQRLAASSRTVYMLANQLPLLELGFVKPPGAAAGAAVPLEGLEGFLAARQAGFAAAATPGTSQPLLVVAAISDPNDLLSFPISPEFARRHGAGRTTLFVNVTKSVARRSILGLAVHPLQAHTGHDRDAEVLALLAHGEGSLPAACRSSQPQGGGR